MVTWSSEAIELLTLGVNTFEGWLTRLELTTISSICGQIKRVKERGLGGHGIGDEIWHDREIPATSDGQVFSKIWRASPRLLLSSMKSARAVRK